MAEALLTCPACGHQWTVADPAPSNPEEIRALCPMCRQADQSTRQPSGPGQAVGLNQPEPTGFAPGHIVAGFEILEEINRGGMGVIYKARQLNMNRLVALKAINPAKLNIPTVRARFESEVKAAALLNHVNIVTVYQADLDGPLPYLAMEYVPGIDLLRLVRKTGPLPVLDAVYYIRQAAEGLQHAYERGLVHRDIKPSNLIVTPAPIGDPQLKGRLPRVKILDMGLARVIHPDGTDSDAGISQPGYFLGTPDYAAPEQAEDATKADTRSDIFSLGATFYFLLTGKVPFPGRTLVEKVRQALSGPPDVRSRRPELPPAVESVLRRMLAPDPRRRYQTPAELAAALDRILRGEKAPLDDLPEAFAPSLLLKEVQLHQGPLRALAFPPDGQTLLSVGDDARLLLLDPETLEIRQSITGDFGAVEQLAVAPGGEWAATCATRLTTEEVAVQLWDLGTGREVRRLVGPAENIRCLAIRPDGSAVAAGARDGRIWIWILAGDDATGDAEPFCLPAHDGPVTGVVFTGHDTLLSVGQDGTLRQWSLSSAKPKAVKPLQAGPLYALAFARNRLAVAAEQQIVIRRADRTYLHVPVPAGSVRSLVISGDGRVLLGGGSTDSARIWSVEEGTEAAVLSGHHPPVRALAIAPDRQTAYTGDDAGVLRRWQLPTI